MTNERIARDGDSSGLSTGAILQASRYVVSQGELAPMVRRLAKFGCNSERIVRAS